LRCFVGGVSVGAAVEEPGAPGTFTFTSAVAAPMGPMCSTAKATDAAGNESAASAGEKTNSRWDGQFRRPDGRFTFVEQTSQQTWTSVETRPANDIPPTEVDSVVV